jgi:hypothetical protein
MFRAENDMHQIEAQRLRHDTDYMPGLQPLPASTNAYLGLWPRLVCFGPSALGHGFSRAATTTAAYLGLWPRLVCFGPSALGHGFSRATTTTAAKGL